MVDGTDVAKHLIRSGAHENALLSDAEAWMSSATAADIKCFQDAGSSVWATTQGPGDITFTPPGFLCLHNVLNTSDCVGYRLFGFSQCDRLNYCELDRGCDNAKKPSVVKKEILALLDATFPAGAAPGTPVSTKAVDEQGVLGAGGAHGTEADHSEIGEGFFGNVVRGELVMKGGKGGGKGKGHDDQANKGKEEVQLADEIGAATADSQTSKGKGTQEVQLEAAAPAVIAAEAAEVANSSKASGEDKTNGQAKVQPGAEIVAATAGSQTEGNGTGEVQPEAAAPAVMAAEAAEVANSSKDSGEDKTNGQANKGNGTGEAQPEDEIAAATADSQTNKGKGKGTREVQPEAAAADPAAIAAEAAEARDSGEDETKKIDSGSNDID